MDYLWRIELLGDLRVVGPDRVLTRFRSQKTGALLAYLAFYRERAHPRDLLIDLLWPEEDLDAARMKLRTALASLRRQLEPPGVPRGAALGASRLDVCLNPAVVTTDVAQFQAALQSAARAHTLDTQTQHLDEAIALYRGTLLPGYYEAWILPEQRKLSELFLHELLRVVAALEQAGDMRRALAYADQAVVADPVREEAPHELIRLYAAAGQPAAARRQYRELERLLREELGETPSPTTRALIERLPESGGAAAGLGARLGRPPLADQADEGSSGRTCEPGGSAPAEHGRGAAPPPPSSASQVIRSSGHHPISRPLPLPPTRFFGREGEIARVRQRLVGEGVRLVTLTGPGGSGKTRLALEAAARLREALDGTVWFVPLADLAEPRRIIDAIHAALALPRLPHAEPWDQVVAALSTRPSLLVLDNLEHLLPAACPVVRDLLEQIPLLQCLVTSRQILELAPEREIMVGPLPVPGVQGAGAAKGVPAQWVLGRSPGPRSGGPGRSGAREGRSEDLNTRTPEYLNTLLQNESVGLFVDRAQRVRPHFQLTPGNAAAVAELCRRLEGIPLAIELAAVRTRELSPSRMLRQLEGRLDCLASRKRDLPSRHQTLRAAIDWSYQLLSPELQRFFARLFPFRGGFTAEAAAAVTAELLSRRHLGQVHDCSLVLTETDAQEPRYRLLETLREYVAEQLSPEERAQVADRHAEYYRVWAEPAGPELHPGPQQNSWLDRLELEHDNLRAALDWAEETGSVERGFQLAASLEGFWGVRSHLAEGQQRLTRLLDLAGATIPDVVRARTLNSIGWFTHRRGAYAAAVPLHQQALEISRRLGDRHGITDSLRNLGAIAQKEGNSEMACRYLEESLAMSEAMGDKRGIARSMSNLGLTLLYSGRHSRARILFEQALKLEQELALDQQSGPSFAIAANLNNLGFTLLCLGHLDEARSLLVQSLRLKQELGNADGIPYGLEGLAEWAAGRGQWARAVRLLAAADAARDVGGHPRCPPSECAHCEGLLALARVELGAEAFAVAWSEGSAWNADQGVAYALQEVEMDSRTG